MNTRDIELPDGESNLLWKLQRAGWICMFLFILAAVLGFTGTGPLGQVRARGAGIEVDYSKFKRRCAPSVTEVRVSPVAPGPVRVWISREYLGHFAVEHITPQPQSTASSEQIVSYTFANVPEQALVAYFHLRGLESTVGWVSGSIGVEGAGEVKLSEFVWP